MNGVDDRIARMTGGWFRNSYGVIVNGVGWEISKDEHPHDCGFCASGEPMLHQYEGDGDEIDPGEPWSLWHHGEYVANYATVTDAKAGALPLDCSKCAGE